MRSNPHFDFSHLTVAERIQLAEDLWESIEPSVEELPLPPELAAELDRRMAELDAHPERAVPWEEVRARLYARFGAEAPDDSAGLERGG